MRLEIMPDFDVHALGVGLLHPRRNGESKDMTLMETTAHEKKKTKTLAMARLAMVEGNTLGYEDVGIHKYK